MPSEIRKSMEWKRVPAPNEHSRSKFVKVWEDKYGHIYYYDPVADVFWHWHEYKGSPSVPAYWLRSNTGFGR